MVCRPVAGRFAWTGWHCVDIGEPAEILAAGERCERPSDRCGPGTHCALLGDAYRCVGLCDPVEPSGSALLSCGDDEACVPTALGEIGSCGPKCSPYPRRPGEYECDPGHTCSPFVPRSDVAAEPEGVCIEEAGLLEAGSLCSPEAPACRDLAQCVDLNEDGLAECRPLCRPFRPGRCDGEATCTGIAPLRGQLWGSFCFPEPQPGEIGDRCLDE